MAPELLKKAHELLECQRNCDAACHGCLLAFDTQHRIKKLNRHRALEFLDDDFLSGLELPTELRFFSDTEDARFEFASPDAALAREIHKLGASQIRIHLGGKSQSWDIVDWSLRDRLLRWVSSLTHPLIFVTNIAGLRTWLTWTV